MSLIDHSLGILFILGCVIFATSPAWLMMIYLWLQY